MVVDDQAMVREGVAVLLGLQPDMVVVADVADGEQAVRAAREHDPDVILMDIRLPVLDGLEATRRILDVPPGRSRPRVIMLTTFELDEYIFEALRAGASGFLLKGASAADLAQAVRVVASGESLLSPSVTRRLIEEFSARPAPRATGGRAVAALTARETEVLTLIAGGLSNAEIAKSLVVAEETVKTHVGRIFTKLDLRDRAQAVIVAYEAGLVVPRG
ncbi:response regulator [Actinoplanes italicus]|uniref:LuxR family two component transcriptional regulator n=1 Tax=Actinoplanes italicus TaxID=113567 RepID=A0A2T0KFN4_9ACTN|nr:response regulator transcription factor [Actinoplanes italicus]PRX22174.1 LuxR family two component transcriptional regulator [Actinoplanes italicus]